MFKSLENLDFSNDCWRQSPVASMMHTNLFEGNLPVGLQASGSIDLAVRSFTYLFKTLIMRNRSRHIEPFSIFW